MVFSLQSPLNHPVMKMSIETPVVYQPAVGIWFAPTGLQSAAFQEKCCKNNTPAIPLSNTWAQLCALAKKSWAVVLHPALPSPLYHPFCVWAAPPGFWHPALWILPWFCPTVTIVVTLSCVPINIYLALLPCFLPLQAHGPCFSLPRTCGSLQGSPALLSCRNKHLLEDNGLPIAIC